MAFHGHLASYKNSIWNFVASLIHLLFHLNFFMPRATTSPRTKTNREVRSKMKFKACLAKICLRQNYYETSKLLFQCRLMQLFLTGIFLLTIAFEKCLRSKGNLFKKSLQKVVRRNAVQIFPDFPAKRL